MLENIKLQDIERRLKRLEKHITDSTFCYYLNEKSSESEETAHNFEYYFEAHSANTLKLQINIETNKESACVVNILVNGIKVLSAQNDQIIAEYSLVLPFAKGKNKVEVCVESEEGLKIEKCALSTFGNISYLRFDYVISCVNEEDRSIIAVVSNGKCSVKEYKNGTLTTVYQTEGIISGAVCKMGEYFLLVTVNEQGVGTLMQFDSSFVLQYDKQLDTGLSSVCAISGDSPSVFAVRGNCVYRYNVEEMLFFVKRNTGYNGKKVKCNPQVSDYIIIVDHEDNSKLVSV